MFKLQHLRLDLKALAFSPDGTRLAACGQHGTVQVWDPATRELVVDWVTGPGLHGLAFLAPAVLALPRAGAVARLDLTTGGWLDLLPLTGSVQRIAVAPDRTALAVASYAGVTCWPLPDVGRPAWAAAPGDGPFDSLAWSPDGRAVVAGTYDGRVVLFDAATGAEVEELGRAGASAVTAVAFAPDGATLVWCGGPRLYRRRGGVTTFRTLGRTHFLGVAWHPAGSFFATANGDGTVDFWDASTGERRESFGWGVRKMWGVAFDPSGDRAACCGAGGAIVVWDVER